MGRERESLLHSFTLAHPMHRLIWGYAGTPHSNSHCVQQERPQHSSLWKVHCLDPRHPFLARRWTSSAWWRWTSSNSRIKILHSSWLAAADVSWLIERRLMLAHAEMFSVRRKLFAAKGIHGYMCLFMGRHRSHTHSNGCQHCHEKMSDKPPQLRPCCLVSQLAHGFSMGFPWFAAKPMPNRYGLVWKLALPKICWL